MLRLPLSARQPRKCLKSPRHHQGVELALIRHAIYQVDLSQVIQELLNIVIRIQVYRIKRVRITAQQFDVVFAGLGLLGLGLLWQ